MMKIKLEKEIILNVTKKMEHIIPKKPSINILTGILIVAKEGKINISSTNLDEYLQVSNISGFIEEEGQVIINCRELSTITKQLKPGLITLEVKDQKLILTQDQFNIGLNTLPTDEFPLMPNDSNYNDNHNKDFEDWFSIDYKTFKNLVSQVSFIPLKNEFRPFVSSVNIETIDSKLRLVGTDTNMLGFMEESAMVFSNSQGLINNENLKRLFKLFTTKEEKDLQLVKVDLNGRWIVFTIGNLTYINGNIDSQYPRYGQVIPVDFDGKFSINVNSFLSVLKLLKTNSASVEIQRDTDKLILTSKTENDEKPDVSMTVGIFENKNYSDKELKLIFHADLLINTLESISSLQDSVALEFIGTNNKPIKISVENGLYVIMPKNPKNFYKEAC